MNEYMYAVSGVFDTLVIMIYFDAVLKKRRGRWVSFAIFGVLCAGCLGSYFCNASGKPLMIILWSVITLLGLSFLYEGTVAKRIFYVILTQVIAMISEGICGILGQIPFLEKMLDKQLRDSVELILSKLFFFLFVLIILLLKKQHGNIPKKHLLYFTLVPLISVIVVYGLGNGQKDVNIRTCFVSLLGVLLLNIVVYYILSLLSDYAANQVREEVLQEQIQMQRDNYEQLSQSFKRGNRLLHDVNKHLRQVGQYLSEQKWEQATCYLEQIEVALQENYKIVKSGNIVVDSILSNLKNQMEMQGITFVLEMNVDSSRLKIDDYDLVTILANITDNVIEEMGTMEQGTVWVRLETTEDEILLFVRNPINKGRKKRIKKDEWFHGFGIQNIKETVEKYGGSSSFEKKEEDFETMIMIPYGECEENVIES